ncbi:MAG: DUF5054 domain-containing protein [Cellulosilyticaceae bacterium]
MNNADIKKVHVVFKTHLDIGFTDMGSNVLDRYLNQFIPQSIDLALSLNTENDKKFIWTVGSYLIDYYLKNATTEQIDKLDEAIAKGYIRWHGISCTTHTELMDGDLFAYSLEIGAKLDRKYNIQTIASKMTDVPGHTIGMLPHLAKQGIQYMHIGVNPSSRVPDVPEVFLWKHGDSELIVHYSSQYGLPLAIDGFEEALVFAHTADNLGPPTAAQITQELDRIAKLYPNATIEASTLDAFAQSLLEIKHKLPIIEEEIGDTWIHGVGSDPLRIGAYKELCNLRHKWLAEGSLDINSPEYDAFMINLIMIAEHTWGLDIKKYLADFKNWSKEDFQKARLEDKTTLELLTYRNAHMLGCIEYDINNYRGGVFDGSYKHYESSHEEQRAYIQAAITSLPLPLQAEAHAAVATISPVYTEVEGTLLPPNRTHMVNGWNVRIGGNGQIYYLERDGKVWTDGGEIGLLQYEVFDAVNCKTNYYQYNRDFFATCSWSEGDFSKPGLEFVEDLKNKCYDFAAGLITQVDHQIFIDLYGDSEACDKYGSPRKAQLIYTFLENKLDIELKWFDKDANRIPEALWFKFNFDVANPNRWMMHKLGTPVSPLDVVRGGNRKQHCVEKLVYQASDGQIILGSLSAPLVSIGGRNLYEADDRFNDLSNGFYYALFNNRWGTNFKMWFEEDCAFKYEITFTPNLYK